MSGTAGQLVQAGVVHEVNLHAPPPTPAAVVPRQLPAAPGPFTGREAELDRLDRALAPTGLDEAATASHGHVSADRLAGPPVAGAAVMVSAIGGAGGIGKTWLALTWAHRHLERFPDGQLFVDLHGFSPAGDPTEPAAAVRGFLDALEVDPGRIPTNLDAQAALYRSLVAGRRMLIVLDNAATSDQVVPLLPGSPTCTVLITGRHRLASLIDRHGARHLPLDVMSHDEARGLLIARLGGDRVAAEPDAVDELIRLCGRYPLALSITARHAGTRAVLPLAEIVADLRELGLDALDHDSDPTASLSTVLSWSLRGLTDQQRTVFALLGTAPGSDISFAAAVSLMALPTTATRTALRALEDSSLIDRHAGGRYAMHDLIRSYAAVLAHGLDATVRQAALERVVDHYLHTAREADHLVDPIAMPIRLDPPAPGTRPDLLRDDAAAMAWLDAEHLHLLAAQRTAAAQNRHDIVWNLAMALTTFQHRRGHLHDNVTVWRAALTASGHLPDPIARIRAHRNLGTAQARLGEREQAVGHLRRALALAEHNQDTNQQAATHYDLAMACGLQGDDQQALHHARHALTLYQEAGRSMWEAITLNLVGWYSAQLGDYDTARAHCQAALTLTRQYDNPAAEADIVDSLGWIDHHTGRHRRAIKHYLRALTLYRGLGTTYAVATTLDNLGHPHAALDQHDQARAVWQEALTLYREQDRGTDALRVQQQLDDLDLAGAPSRPSPDTGGDTTGG
ncbi:tetratricopeptide repeat protein [Actinosynnema sp. NPDC023794]